MKNDEELAPTWMDKLPAPQRRGRRWLLIGGLAFAFMLALGVGTLLGSMTSTTQARPQAHLASKRWLPREAQLTPRQ